MGGVVWVSLRIVRFVVGGGGGGGMGRNCREEEDVFVFGGVKLILGWVGALATPYWRLVINAVETPPTRDVRWSFSLLSLSLLLLLLPLP